MRYFIALLCAIAIVSPAHAGDAARGKYLAILGDCAGCHTVPKQAAFAGGLAFNSPFGVIYSTNITPDQDTGIGRWSGEDFYRALHEGTAPGGKHLYPALPYLYFARLTRQDTDDLYAYLKTLAPVKKAATPNKLAFPFNLRFGLIFWKWLYRAKTPPIQPSNASGQWKRGEYIVNGLGHCAACHTPKDMLFGDERDRPLGGGLVDHWFANNLTGAKVDGLGQWSRMDVEKFLATGINTHATAAGSMAEKISSSTSHMTDADRAAIAVYLKSLPAYKPRAFEQPRREKMERGQALFTAHCEACHAVPGGKPRAGQGVTAGYPDLAGDTLVMGRNPTTVLRIILQGSTALSAPGVHPKPMPGFGKLDDGEIADVATFIRNAWGNHAAAVSATEVHGLRQALASH